MTAAMGFAFNQMTQAEARRKADELSESPGAVTEWSAVPVGDGTYNVMPREIAAIKHGLSTEMAESVFQPSEPAHCAAFCAAAVVATTPIVGDISGMESASALNSAADLAELSDKTLTVLKNHPNENIAAFANDLSRSPTALRIALIVPASVNNYQACYSECTSHYFER
ncbi:hypothetical protein HFP89_06060 [Wenzhouxiangella sp. XN79A]|uniref:hypothetical protein n=1 Tax=Wenzhouxiangella sp. XN79A TaxID=2724193 RepID=UPI00144AC12B|nr:hypothetical protein [Wenzhouxiangella sp. XN79A]NKI34725.1 hypothetical protein [Wenzhouxiangella sp. XN79A]